MWCSPISCSLNVSKYKTFIFAGCWSVVADQLCIWNWRTKYMVWWAQSFFVTPLSFSVWNFLFLSIVPKDYVPYVIFRITWFITRCSEPFYKCWVKLKCLPDTPNECFKKCFPTHSDFHAQPMPKIRTTLLAVEIWESCVSTAVFVQIWAIVNMKR